ncbi:MAG: 4-oxalocrotonate tautomerase [Methanosarcinales archaeon]|nr:MAG: 4-oxalocrotonate tautomerase [Euryarchaeota archaeon 55_53]MDN5295154.1 4-oxalocrotonate tautomerase [Methanosarcinales archaeon]
MVRFILIDMPVITVDGPTIEDIEVKRALVEELTRAAARAYGLPEQAIIVLIKESSPENVGVGGRLVCDRYER